MIAMVKLNKTDELIISILKTAGKELTFAEIVEKSGERPKKIFTSIRKLFENEIVDAKERKYKLANP
mgnify:CR=1 FL=1